MWTDENTERLRQLWHDGMSARIIAGMIGGATRNAVIGKAHRLGLPQRRPAYQAVPRRKPVKSGHYDRGYRLRLYDYDAILDRWAAGASEGEISREFGMNPPAVRRIVCDCRRRGDPRAAPHGHRKRIVIIQRAPRPAPVRAPVPVPPSLNLGLMDLADKTCKWAVTDPPRGGTFLFCGHITEDGKPYCSAHCRLAYRVA